ncbi:MAG: BREX system P-loop protein BrxC [Candidatus Obscuribacterales bacterium]|nr:BREX system P-loop protein BrxC [Candidatus Obscuribacterales bacterium]
MFLKDLFDKPVNRPIEGVIKADDAASLRTEILEYVLTNEVAKRLEGFLYAYNNYENANGVWISGFFGSGKSHLLKMLALLVENKKIGTESALELFLSKCGENEILRGDLKRAAQIPSKSILFNIDQKADVISKKQVDALLSVFVKVFDETCGYYGKQGHIAQFERDLDERGLLAKFREDYHSLSGRTWEEGREQSLLESQNIANAYSKVTGIAEQNAIGILDKYRSQYKVSIEDFADQVCKFIEKQGKDFRLNFFVDEVGQFIADNTKLMTNLQTIAESLATKCRGRAWVIVTAQEDMNTVVGEMSKQQGNDFSKIQARFANRMKLTSADVAEVIQRRLLSKNEEGVIELTSIYRTQSNNFKTLFDFAEGSQSYRNFVDRDHFIHSYPFIPYQFTLFQSAIQNLSQHNAFEGQHSSVGERSMLGVFQQVAVRVSGHTIGQLATFDQMFEGIRSSLKSQIQRAIIVAEKNLENEFAVRILKALFLVKYVKEFRATVRNLCVLLLDSFDQDLPALKIRIEEGLNILEKQTYIQRNGEQYEFLTDEEKDIEQEIKNTEVETSAVSEELSKIIFDSTLKTKKIRFDASGQDFQFSKKLDDKLIGREHELAINVITPFHEHSENLDVIRMQSTGRDELVVLMPSDDRLMRDVLMYKQTEKYTQQNMSVTQQESIKRILMDKQFQNRERYADLHQLVQKLLGKANLIVAGSELEVKGEDGASKIYAGFQELVIRSYPNLRTISGSNYSETDIGKLLQQVAMDTELVPLSEAEQEVLSFINSNSRSNIRTTMKAVVDKFEKKPYGWYLAVIQCIVAKLYAKGKVEARSDGNLLEKDSLEDVLKNGHSHGTLVLEPQIDFSATQVRKLKEFYEEFFEVPPQSTDAKSLGKESAHAFKGLLLELDGYEAQSKTYPFSETIKSTIELLRVCTGKPYGWYLTELSGQKESLFDLKDRIVDPLRTFMKGPKKEIFDSAFKFVQAQESNFSYIEGSENEEIVSALRDPDCLRGNRLQQVKTLMEQLSGRITDKVQEEITQATDSAKALKDRLSTTPDFGRLSASQQQEIIKPFETLTSQIEEQKLIAVIRDRLRVFEDFEYPRLLSKIDKLIQESDPKQSVNQGSAQQSSSSSSTGTADLQIEYVSSKSIKIVFEKAWLAEVSEVDEYLQLVREAWLEELRKGKRIRI